MEHVPNESFIIHILIVMILKIETLKLWVCQWGSMKQLANIISTIYMRYYDISILGGLT